MLAEITASVALLVQIATLIGVVIGFFAIREVHVTMNSRLDQLLASEGTRMRAEGRAEGVTEGRAMGPEMC